MKYISTRGIQQPLSSSEALRQGVPVDGGLFVPDQIPSIDQDWLIGLAQKPYSQVVAEVLELYLGDFDREDLQTICQEVFCLENFGEQPAHLEQINPYNHDLYLLRLDTGPTASNKDYSMLLLPPLLNVARQNTSDNMQQLLLAATTGNAGIAALRTLADKEDYAVMAFFASTGEGGRAEQGINITCGNNCFASVSSASFEELAEEIRLCLADRELVDKLKEHNVILSTANSLNWLRIIPAIAYYCRAAACLYEKERLSIEDEGFVLVVPGGNGSELLAAIYAKKMGVPIAKIIVVTNRNKGLADLIREGSFARKRKVLYTELPGLDVDLPMNVERLLFEALDRDAQKTSIYLNDLINEGIIRLSKEDKVKLNEPLEAISIDDRRIASIILSIYDRTDYALDPHTAGFVFAYESWRDRQKKNLPAVILNTDSPYRFTKTMSEALLGRGYVRGRSSSVLIDELAAEIGLLVPEIFKLPQEEGGPPLPSVKKGEICRTILEQLGIF